MAGTKPVRWIRSASWDATWILSGVPIGLAMMALPYPLPLMVIAFLDTGHLVSPLGMAWSHDGFREIMLRRPRKFILLPLLILFATTLVGATVGQTFDVNPERLGVRIKHLSDFQSPFVLMLVAYLLWNFYHFGAQNFGILRIYQSKAKPAPKRRKLDKWICVALTLFGMVAIPKLFHFREIAMLSLGIFSVNHWLAAIGLSSHVFARNKGRSPYLFVFGALAAGALLFSAMFVRDFAVTASMTMIGLRVGLGFVHFLYDRWVWKLSDPEVRRTIGVDLSSADVSTLRLQRAAA